MRPDQSLHERFTARARAFPERIAVVAPAGRLTYRELDERADELAARIVATGIQPGVPVALCVDRSADLVVAMVATLKAGAAYVPIDPTYPPQRIQYLLADTAAPLVVATRRVAEQIAGSDTSLLWLEDGTAGAPAPALPEVRRDDAAYVIYTSGSTGAPNGVVVEHGNVLRLFEQAEPLYDFSEDDVWTLFHSISFDFSVWEIWGALLYGGRLVVVPPEIAQSPQAFVSFLAEHQVTVLNQTPSAFAQLVAAATGDRTRDDLALRAVIFGGERLDVKLLGPWIEAYGDERPALYNMYGITETTVHVTCRRVRTADLASPETSPLGVPLPETLVSLRDDDGTVVAHGEPGEIYVAGPGVARGYLSRPRLTAERFLDDLDGDGSRWYRSRDRAIQTDDGELVYLGRLDDQLKVRGFRIEPGEIEARLAAHPDVASAIVVGVDFGDGDQRLVASVIPVARDDPNDEDEAALAAGLAAWAREALPEHLCPSRYRILTSLPTTASGKIDREALRALELEEPAATGAAGAGEAATIADIVLERVREIVGEPELEPDDDLFDHGATSLTFARILTELNERFDLALTGAELEEATVEGLVSCVAQAGDATLQTTGG